MDLVVTFVIEILFVVVFAAAIWDYVVRRNPTGRDLALVLAGLAGLFVIELWRRFIGPAPAVLVAPVGIALLLQPVLTLRLVSHVRPVPGWQIGLQLVGLVGLIIPVLALGQSASPFLIVALVIVFAAGELYGAVLLGLEARRRHGSARSRLAIAAVSTGVYGAGFLVVGAGLLGTQAAEVAGAVARVLLFAAAIGYVAAFLPPAPVRRLWQTSGAFSLSEELFGLVDAQVPDIWARFLGIALRVSGGTTGLVSLDSDEGTRILATRGIAPSVAGGLPPDIMTSSTPVQHRVPADLADAPPDARYVGVVQRELGGIHGPVRIALFSTHRSLFWADDAALIGSLARRAAILAERREALAQQEALTDDLRLTVAALQDASRAKSDFLASMSHELRTPLNAIIGFSDLMRAEPAQVDRRSVPSEWIEHISRGGQHLLTLINDVLDLAKVEAGRLDLRRERVDANQLVRDVVAGLQPLADRKRIQVSTEVTESAIVDADRGRLRQVLYNLLANAIKFTPDGGRIGIQTRRSGTDVQIAVADTGVGIDHGDLETIFHEFAQVGAAEARLGGTGLGLALTRRLVEAHGGTVRVDSTPGSGSTFTISLPAVPVPAATGVDAMPAAGERRLSPEVLVIEDDPSAARLLREYLESAGYAVRIAGGGQAGLAESRRDPPAAILLDLLLPDLDGWEVLRALKADDSLRDIPVIIATVVDEREVGLALGAVDYFVKPIDRRALMTGLRRLALVDRVRTRSVRILAIDDDPASLDFISATLEPEGFEVIRAGGGPDALSMLDATPVDLVICDLVMPQMDGIEVVWAIREREATRATPIIISTAHPLTESDKRRLNGKILGVVEKGQGAEAGLRAWLRQVVPPAGMAVSDG